MVACLGRFVQRESEALSLEATSESEPQPEGAQPPSKSSKSSAVIRPFLLHPDWHGVAGGWGVGPALERNFRRLPRPPPLSLWHPLIRTTPCPQGARRKVLQDTRGGLLNPHAEGGRRRLRVGGSASRGPGPRGTALAQFQRNSGSARCSGEIPGRLRCGGGVRTRTRRRGAALGRNIGPCNLGTMVYRRVVPRGS